LSSQVLCELDDSKLELYAQFELRFISILHVKVSLILERIEPLHVLNLIKFVLSHEVFELAL